jgi:hypothetical protein
MDRGAKVAEQARARRLTDEEGQELLGIVHVGQARDDPGAAGR